MPTIIQVFAALSSYSQQSANKACCVPLLRSGSVQQQAPSLFLPVKVLLHSGLTDCFLVKIAFVQLAIHQSSVGRVPPDYVRPARIVSQAGGFLLIVRTLFWTPFWPAQFRVAARASSTWKISNTICAFYTCCKAGKGEGEEG
jgi:hypothetical protein